MADAVKTMRMTLSDSRDERAPPATATRRPCLLRDQRFAARSQSGAAVSPRRERLLAKTRRAVAKHASGRHARRATAPATAAHAVEMPLDLGPLAIGSEQLVDVGRATARMTSDTHSSRHRHLCIGLSPDSSCSNSMPAASRDARHHRSDRHVEHLGDLRIREFLDVAQPDRLAKRLRQLVERRLQVRVERGPQQEPLRRVAPRPGRSALEPPPRRARCRRRPCLARRVAEPIPPRVVENRVQPRPADSCPRSNRSVNRSALTNVSCTRSSASARFRVSRSAVA